MTDHFFIFVMKVAYLNHLPHVSMVTVDCCYFDMLICMIIGILLTLFFFHTLCSIYHDHEQLHDAS